MSTRKSKLVKRKIAKRTGRKSKVAYPSPLDYPVSRFVQESVIVYADDAVRDAAKLMRDKQVGSVLVAEKTGELVGIVTEWDLIARVLASDRDVERTRLREVMSSPLLKVDSDTRVQDALRLMTNRGLRRLAVMEDGVIVGMITQSQLIGNRRRHGADLPLVEAIRGLQCAFCNANFSSRKEVLSHVEEMHKGSQYLEIEEKQELES